MSDFGLSGEFFGEGNDDSFPCLDGVAIGNLYGRSGVGWLHIDAVWFGCGVEIVSSGAGVYDCGMVCLRGWGD